MSVAEILPIISSSIALLVAAIALLLKNSSKKNSQPIIDALMAIAAMFAPPVQVTADDESRIVRERIAALSKELEELQNGLSQKS